MSALENKLVNDAVDGHGAADQLQLGVGGVAEDEVGAVKARQGLPANTSCELFCRRELSAIQGSWRREICTMANYYNYKFVQHTTGT